MRDALSLLWENLCWRFEEFKMRPAYDYIEYVMARIQKLERS